MTQYSKMGKPRIYVSAIDYIYSLGIDVNITAKFEAYGLDSIYLEGDELNKVKRMMGLSMNAQEEITVPYDHSYYYRLSTTFYFDSKVGSPSPWDDNATGIEPTQLNNFLKTINFDMWLGHNFNELGIVSATCVAIGFNPSSGAGAVSVPNRTAYINERGTDGDGYSIYTYDGWNSDDTQRFYGVIANINSYLGTTAYGLFYPNDKIKMSNIIWGTYYDFDQYPDLGVTQSFSYDGIDSIKTRGGSTLTNVRYAGAPSWGNGAPFHNDYDIDSDFGLVKNMGRRSWDVSFSYIDEKKMLPYNSMGHVSGEYDDSSDSFSFNTGDTDKPNFVGTVLSKTLGGKLKFIWQPNVDVEEFYICTIPENTISITEVSNKVYNISFKVEEAW